MTRPSDPTARHHSHVPAPLDRDLLEFILAEHEQLVLPRLGLLWDYYRNELTDSGASTPESVADRPYRLAQERGLPPRLRDGVVSNGPTSQRRERVIENDIAWRIHALVDFMFGRPFTVQSLAGVPGRAAAIETFLRRVFDANGGIGFFHDLALLGAVYGHVDILLRTDAVRSATTPQRAAMTRAMDHVRRTSTHPSGPGSAPPTSAASPANHGGGPAPAAGAPGAGTPGAGDGDPLAAANPRDRATLRTGAASFEFPADLRHALAHAGEFVLETIEAPRTVPVLNPADYRRLDAYVLHYRQVLNTLDDGPLYARLRDAVLGRRGFSQRRATLERAEVWTDHDVRQLTGPAGSRRAVSHTINRLGRIPVVHIQNLPQPFFYDGLSEVEPLIPLQDELNTRLSDRANRVTFQSFKMYLGKGIENFLERDVGPGQMWATDNPNASIEAFGGDAACPSEESHINEIREAMDKVSCVTPIAAGVIRDRVGNLTSENALRVTLMGMLSRTEKKRLTYGQGIQKLCELILHAADVLGVLPNAPEERGVRIDWPSPIPESHADRLRDAKVKLELGVPRAQVLAELGYDETPAA